MCLFPSQVNKRTRLRSQGLLPYSQHQLPAIQDVLHQMDHHCPKEDCGVSNYPREGRWVVSSYLPRGGWVVSSYHPRGGWVVSSYLPRGGWVVSSYPPRGGWVVSSSHPREGLVVSSFHPKGDWVESELDCLEMLKSNLSIKYKHQDNDHFKPCTGVFIFVVRRLNFFGILLLLLLPTAK